MRDRDQQRLNGLGYDSRFQYPNIQVNKKYHIVIGEQPQRTVFDFAPVNKSCSGVPGTNYLHKLQAQKQTVVRSILSAKSPSHSSNLYQKFNCLDRQDRPYNKLGEAINPIMAEANYISSTGRFSNTIEYQTLMTAS
jgi:hypothetical protein